MKFEITPEQEGRVKRWLIEEVYPDLITQQKKENPNAPGFVRDFWEAGYPYEGAIGGGLTYEFTPNSIGCHIQANAYGKTLDLTDYEDW